MEHAEQVSPGPQINDLFEWPDLAKVVETTEFRHFLDHIPIAIIISKLMRGEQRLVYANHAFERLTGRTLAEIGGRSWAILDAFSHEDDAQLTLGQAVSSGEDFLGTFRLQRPGSPAVLVEVCVGIIEKEDGTENYRIAALVDVTERERAQREEFARQIRDKDLSLRELQHRVKNNLQLITALIRFEARHERSGELANLNRLAGRIESLQLLYQTLSTEPGKETIDLGHYLSQIASAVMRTHAVDGIHLDLKVDHAPVSINIAMPVGLAVNELLTNAFKYAFVGRDSGTIALQCLRESDDRYRIIVADDGVGLPAGVQWPVDGKLGALIVQTLRENATTDINVESSAGKGTRVTISFVHSTLAKAA
jgi:PAS domain S-box-containing protein